MSTEVVCLESSQIDAASKTLAYAFNNDPIFRHFAPEREQARIEAISLVAALLLAILGFLPGFVLSFGLYQVTYAVTLLPISMTVDRAITVLVLTVIMCSVSGAIAMRKLRSADPADVF